MHGCLHGITWRFIAYIVAWQLIHHSSVSHALTRPPHFTPFTCPPCPTHHVRPQAAFLTGGLSAAFLTGGLYLHSTRPNALLQDLLLVFGVDQFSRDFITLPQPSAVDFRASCFCHKRPVDMGFVCSVCLSIFCSPARTCATCGAEFASAKRTRVNPSQQQQQQ
ncbi:unnamed protein product [Closterium sp. NIES-54]